MIYYILNEDDIRRIGIEVGDSLILEDSSPTSSVDNLGLVTYENTTRREDLERKDLEI